MIRQIDRDTKLSGLSFEPHICKKKVDGLNEIARQNRQNKTLKITCKKMFMLKTELMVEMQNLTNSLQSRVVEI